MLRNAFLNGFFGKEVNKFNFSSLSYFLDDVIYVLNKQAPQSLVVGTENYLNTVRL